MIPRQKRFTYALLTVILFGFTLANGVRSLEANPPQENHFSVAAQQVQLAQGQEYLRKGQYDLAASLFQEALQLDPDNEDAKRLLAQAESHLNGNDELSAAEQDARAQAELAAQLKQILAEADRVATEDGLEAAADLYRKALMIHPDNREARNALRRIENAERRQRDSQIKALLDEARTAVRAENFDGAREAYKSVLALQPDNRDATRGLESVADAEKSAQQKAVAEKVDSFLREGRLALRNDAFEDARSYYNQVLALDPENRDASRGLESIAQAEGAAALRARQNQIAASNSAGRDLLGSGDIEGAKAAYLAALEMDPDNRTAQRGMRDVERAEENARKARIDGLLGQARSAYRDNRYDDARALYAQVLEMDAGNRTATQGMARVTDSETAAREAQTAEIAAIREREARLAMEAEVEELLARAAALSEQNDYEGAAKAAREALALDPRNRQAYRALERSERSLADAAAEASRAAQDLLAQPQVVVADIPEIVPASNPSAPAQAPEVTLPAVAALAESAAPQAEEYIEAVESDPASQASAVTGEWDYEMDAEFLAPAEAAPVMEALEAVAPAVDQMAISQQLSEAQRIYATNRLDVEKARALWENVLDLDPENKTARTMLEETQSEFDRLVADRATRRAAEEQERQGEMKLRETVNVSTVEPAPLADFLQILSFATGINFSIVEGSEARVSASFVDKPLRDILDTVLLPIGLKWARERGDVIVISADLKTKVFNLNRDEIAKVQRLMEENSLQQILYGPGGIKPLDKTLLQLDEREGILMAVDSAQNIEKLSKFLESMRAELPRDLETRIFFIREEQGPEIKALIDALISVDKTPYDLERSVYLEGRNLIVHDTPEHLRRIEEILSQKDFLRGLEEGRIELATFSLIPREALQTDPELALAFANNIVEVIETLLYTESGIARAREEGRRYWFDPTTFQLTITDYPDRISAVGNYIASLPQLEQRPREKVIRLKEVESAEMESYLTEMLDLAPTVGTEGVGAMEVTRTLRREQEMTWRDLSIRVRRVNENNVDDPTDDSVDLIVRTSTQSQNISIIQYESVFVEDYEIIAEDVRPSGGEGRGRVVLKVRYVPQETMQFQVEQTQAQIEAEQERLRRAQDETALRISTFPTQNALIVRYMNPADLERVERLVAQLDKPTPQVNIETRFVTVNEQRAKEFSSEWNFLDLSDPRLSSFTQLVEDPDNPGTFFPVTMNLLEQFSNNVFSGGFANDFNELRSIFEPGTQNPALGANLLKGSTVINSVLGSFMGNQVSWELRLLEAEGIINVVNGPHIVVMSNDEAIFEIHRLPVPPILYSTPYIDAEGNVVQGARDFFPAGYETELDLVLMTVGAQVTSENSILLDIDVEITDYEGASSGNLFWAGESQGMSGLTQQRDFRSLTAVGGYGAQSRQRKLVQTKARIKSGGTIVLGGWTGEFSQDLTSGVPGLRNLPYLGKLFFSRNQFTTYKTTLLIFLSGQLVD